MRAISSKLSRRASRSKSWRSSKTSATAVLRSPFKRRSSTAVIRASYGYRSGKSNAGEQVIITKNAVGGGGASPNGLYSVSGTIGQADAGAMSGGSYSVVGGFWGILWVVQTPGAPLLRIQPTATNAVVVAWPSPSSGFKLQFNTDLKTMNSTEMGQAPTVVGGENQVIVAPAGGNRFYRLR